MNNILPELKVAKYHGASSSARKASFSEWVPSDANGITGSIPSYIETEFTKVDNHEGKFKENKLPVEEPNERHIDTRKVALLQPSPLGITERGVTEEPRIVFEPPEPLNKTQNTIVIEANTRYVHLLRMINYLPTYMDLYTQKKLTMLHSIVNPSSYSVRCKC